MNLTEAELTLRGQAVAKDRLDEANRLMAKTAHLAPGNPRRDQAVRKLREATAVASEWGVIPSAVEQVNAARRRRAGGAE